MDNLETVSINLDKEYEKYCEEVNSPASKGVRDAYSKYSEDVDNYIAEVSEDSWKHGFQYAVSLKENENVGNSITASHECYSLLEDILFKNERLDSLLSCLQSLVAEGVVEVCGLPENAFSYSLYEIEMELYKNNKILKELISEGKII